MATRTGSFGLDACIVGGRWTHSRLHDHDGTDMDIYVSLSASYGGYLEGTPIFYVIQDLVNRMIAMESGHHRLDFFGINAYVCPYFALDSVISSTGIPWTTTLDCWIVGGGNFGLAAVIRGAATFGLDAVLV